MSRRIATVLLVLLGSTLCLPAQAQWKWRDRSGQTQYSDLPPPAAVPEQDILQRPQGATRRAGVPAAATAAASAAPLLAARGSDPELEARRKKIEQDALDKKKAEEAKVAAAKAENCTRAKSQMRSLDSGVRMTRTNDKGEREYLDDTARAAEAKRTREMMSSDCQ
jgi:hypothetical protein